MIKIEKIIIWGYKLFSHTHSFIHKGYYEGFKKLGYEVYWFDHDDNVSNFNFNNSLFITEHNCDINIPLNSKSLYFVHNLYNEISDYNQIPRENVVDFRCSFRDMLRNGYPYYLEINKYAYGFVDKNNKIFYTLWGTDIFPEEIDNNIKNLDKFQTKREIVLVGSPTKEWEEVWKWCKNNQVRYVRYGASFNVRNRQMNKDIKETQKLIQESLIAPAIQTELQIKDHYVPCRIFKNISYGKMGITNSKFVNELFDNKLIYDKDVNECLNKGMKFKDMDKLKELMIYVRDNHTYLNRINEMKQFIKEYTNFRLD